jgi:hypothetical protein
LYQTVLHLAPAFDSVSPLCRGGSEGIIRGLKDRLQASHMDRTLSVTLGLGQLGLVAWYRQLGTASIEHRPIFGSGGGVERGR